MKKMKPIKPLGILGIVQVVASLVLIGLLAKSYHNALQQSKTEEGYNHDNTEAFGPIVIAIWMVGTGVLAVIAERKRSWKIEVAYLIVAVVGICAISTLIWYYAKTLYKIHSKCHQDFDVCSYTAEARTMSITLLCLTIITMCACLTGVVYSIYSGCVKAVRRDNSKTIAT